jgi:hypothetical protein
MTNVYKAKPEEIQAAATEIKAHRQRLNQPYGGNYGFLEGSVTNSNGVVVDLNNPATNSKFWRSGDMQAGEPQIFEAIRVEGMNGKTWLRNTDAEYKMINRLTERLGGSIGNSYTNLSFVV